MKTEIAQVCTLALHANYVFSGGRLPDNFEQNSTFKFCEAIRFFEPKSSLFRANAKMVETANTPAHWIEQMARNGAVRAVVSVAPSHEKAEDGRVMSDITSTVFVGGGSNWFLTIDAPNSKGISWVPQWSIGNDAHEEQKIWHVNYIAFKQSFSTAKTGLQIASERLRTILTEIEKFARSEDLDHWGDVFQNALSQLSGSTKSTFHPDFAPAGYLSDEADQLFRACQIAWVFGGMGSWSDLYCKDGNTYETLTNELFSAVNSAIVEATNSAPTAA